MAVATLGLMRKLFNVRANVIVLSVLALVTMTFFVPASIASDKFQDCNLLLNLASSSPSVEALRNETFVKQCEGTCYLEAIREMVESKVRSINSMTPGEAINRHDFFLRWLFFLVSVSLSIGDEIHEPSYILSTNFEKYERTGKLDILSGSDSFMDTLLAQQSFRVTRAESPESVKRTNRRMQENAGWVSQRLTEYMDKHGFHGDKEVRRATYLEIRDYIKSELKDVSRGRGYELKNPTLKELEVQTIAEDNQTYFDQSTEDLITKMLDSRQRIFISLYSSKKTARFVGDFKVYYSPETPPESNHPNHAAIITGAVNDSRGRIVFLTVKQAWGASGLSGLYLATPEFVLKYSKLSVLSIDGLQTLPSNRH